VDRALRRIEVHSITRLDLHGELLDIELHCSKGTYVRTLAEELAIAFGTVGHLAGLRRLAVDPFGAARMIPLEEVESLADSDPQRLDDWLLPTDAALCDLDAVRLNPDQAAALVHGQVVQVEHAPTGLVRVYDCDGRFLGLTDVTAGGVVRVRRLFVPGAG
jgi:tRNA pseudouridine55 synthase